MVHTVGAHKTARILIRLFLGCKLFLFFFPGDDDDGNSVGFYQYAEMTLCLNSACSAVRYCC